MGYDRGDSFPFDFEPNGNPFGSKSKGNLSPRSYPIQCERKWNTSFLSVELVISIPVVWHNFLECSDKDSKLSSVKQPSWTDGSICGESGEQFEHVSFCR